MTIGEANRTSGVHRATIWRLQQRYLVTQSVESDRHNSIRHAELNESGLEKLIVLVVMHLDMTLEETRKSWDYT